MNPKDRLPVVINVTMKAGTRLPSALRVHSSP